MHAQVDRNVSHNAGPACQAEPERFPSDDEDTLTPSNEGQTHLLLLPQLLILRSLASMFEDLHA